MQFPQGFAFDPAHPFAGDPQRASDGFEGRRFFRGQAVAHPQDLRLALIDEIQDTAEGGQRILLEHDLVGGLGLPASRKGVLGQVVELVVPQRTGPGVGAQRLLDHVGVGLR